MSPEFDNPNPGFFCIKDSVHIDVPRNHQFMISTRTTTAYANGRVGLSLKPNRLSWYDCTEMRNWPAQYLKVERFFVRSGATGPCFHLHFSFHNSTALLARSHLKWNCSVPYWEDFKQHFPCNLNAECIGLEDEFGCPYTYDSRCPPGFIALAGSCFIVLQFQAKISWHMSRTICKRFKARLANLHTPEMFLRVMKFVYDHYGDEEVLTSFRLGRVSSSWPAMYLPIIFKFWVMLARY